MKILLTKTLPTEEGHYLHCPEFGDYRSINNLYVDENLRIKYLYMDIPRYADLNEVGGYWAKLDESMFQLCESEQERREIIQNQHSNDTHRAVDIDRPEPECKCEDSNLIKMDSDKNKNKSMCLNCFKWSKEGEA